MSKTKIEIATQLLSIADDELLTAEIEYNVDDEYSTLIKYGHAETAIAMQACASMVLNKKDQATMRGNISSLMSNERIRELVQARLEYSEAMIDKDDEDCPYREDVTALKLVLQWLPRKRKYEVVVEYTVQHVLHFEAESESQAEAMANEYIGAGNLRKECARIANVPSVQSVHEEEEA